MVTPTLPGREHIGELKDMAQEIIDASARLEGRVAPLTAQSLGDCLRLLNSYYSNLIEGHKTTIPEIEQALREVFTGDEERQYAQELCAAHVSTEKVMMAEVMANTGINVAAPNFLKQIHREFYGYLPAKHLFTHGPKGFTEHPVMPGALRDSYVRVGTHRDIGPAPEDVETNVEEFGQIYAPSIFHGDERLIAMAAAHHRLAWLHPFRDGNGRVCRLFSGLYMANSRINRSNLWSLSRGLSRNKNEYMVNLFSADPDPRPDDEVQISASELLADFCHFFFEICLDQIGFMEKLLRLEEIEARIEWYVEKRTRGSKKDLHPDSSRLLRALFMRGEIERGEGPTILNASETTYRRIVKQLMEEGLVVSDSQRSPLKVGLPTKALPFYFPDLYAEEVVGAEYVRQLV